MKLGRGPVKEQKHLYFVSWFDINRKSIGNSIVDTGCELSGEELVLRIIKIIEMGVSENAVVLTFQAI